MEHLDSRMHVCWLSQLTREYKDICFQYKIALHPPILTISRNKQQMGSWSSADRTLRLSHFLIIAHPWDLTLQILKHEMAHQICCEIYGRDDAGHGPIFREACIRLGLDDRFHKASADLGENIAPLPKASQTTEQGRLIIEKIRKLLALGKSDNEHEAALAVQRAGELLARYRLDFAALAEEQGLVHRTINTGAQTLPIHRKMICTLLETCFAVRVICASLYDPNKDVSFKTIELLGRQEEVATAEHCWYFLENRLRTLWEKKRLAYSGNGRVARKSYYLGLLAGFRETLERSRSRMDSSTPVADPSADLPMVREQQRLDDFVAFRFPRLRRLRRQGSRLNRDAYQEAVAVGREIILHTPMDGSRKQEGRLLLR